MFCLLGDTQHRIELPVIGCWGADTWATLELRRSVHQVAGSTRFEKLVNTLVRKAEQFGGVAPAEPEVCE